MSKGKPRKTSAWSRQQAHLGLFVDPEDGGDMFCPKYPFYDNFTDGRTHWMSDQLIARPLPKHRTTQTQNKHIHIPNTHALCGIRTHDPGFRASEDSTWLRPLGYRDRHSFIIDKSGPGQGLSWNLELHSYWVHGWLDTEEIGSLHNTRICAWADKNLWFVVIKAMAVGILFLLTPTIRGSTSAVGIATGYGLDGWGNWIRVSVRTKCSPFYVIQIGSGAHPASYPMGTLDSFRLGKAAGV
jgi:hypothetical protein